MNHDIPESDVSNSPQPKQDIFDKVVEDEIEKTKNEFQSSVRELKKLGVSNEEIIATVFGEKP